MKKNCNSLSVLICVLFSALISTSQLRTAEQNSGSLLDFFGDDSDKSSAIDVPSAASLSQHSEVVAPGTLDGGNTASKLTKKPKWQKNKKPISEVEDEKIPEAAPPEKIPDIEVPKRNIVVLQDPSADQEGSDNKARKVPSLSKTLTEHKKKNVVEDSDADDKNPDDDNPKPEDKAAAQDDISNDDNKPKEQGPDNTAQDDEKVTKDARGPKEADQEKDKELEPPEMDDEDQMVEFNFNDVELKNLLDYVSKLYNITFLPDDAIKPMAQGGAAVGGIKITFKTQTPLTKKEAWNVFIKFLSISSFTLVPGPMKNFYKVVPLAKANNEPLKAYIGIDYRDLPDDDTKIRYIYFVVNSKIEIIQSVADSLKSPQGKVSAFSDFNALIFTEKSSNIKSIMKIISELDKEMPESMSVLKLKKADVDEVKKLYESLTEAEESQGLAARIFGTGNRTASAYFPDDARIISEPRTNSLILLGNRKSIKRIEDFIKKHVDTDINTPYSPLYTHQLQYAKASSIAQILQTVTRFAPGTTAAQYGGVRGGDKYFKPMQITPEDSTNTIIIKAEKEDYIKVKELIEKLDVLQPQVAIEVLIVSVTITDTKQLGAQLRNKTPGILNSSLDFHSAQLAPVVTKSSSQGAIENVLGNLIGLAKGVVQGSTVLSIGSESAGGVWGLFEILQKHLNAKVVANPFLITTNNSEATVSLGNTRNVTSGYSDGVGGKSYFKSEISAPLKVTVTPKISSAQTVLMNIDVQVSEFVQPDDPNSTMQTTKELQTLASVKNEEVLVLGGLIKNSSIDLNRKVPVLGNIPILGWLFKNKSKEKYKDSTLIFISPKILLPQKEGGISHYTYGKAEHVKDLADIGKPEAENRDPIYRWFFDSSKFLKHEEEIVDRFINREKDESVIIQRNAKEKNGDPPPKGAKA